MVTDAKSKRVRVVAKSQSKNGCFTCRARRIKCDETRPSCLRCARSKRQCEGYRDQISPVVNIESEDDSTSTSASDNEVLGRISALSIRPPSNHDENRLTQLGWTALQCGEMAKGGQCNVVWDTTLLQFCYTSPMVASSLACLGAALEASHLCSHPPANADAMVARTYDQAIRQTQEQVSSRRDSDEALLHSCLLLACAEIVLWREGNAHTHVKGTMRLLRSRDIPETTLPSNPLMTSKTVFSPMNELDIFFVQLDIQTSSYALGVPPLLPEIDMQYLLDIPADMRGHSSLELEALQVVHSSYHIAFLWIEHKYTATSSVPGDVVLKQARCIAHLAACVAKLNKYLSHPSSRSPGLESFEMIAEHALVLRSQCLSALIYLSMASESFECGYDKYATHFQQIIMDGETMLRSNVEMQRQFSIGLGMLQPLFFTASKYRDPVWRRQATALLAKGGREGPFYGKLLAAVASRAIEVEESGCIGRAKPISAAPDIPELDRVHGISLHVNGLREPKKSQVKIKLSRCRDVDRMLASSIAWEDEKNWDTWPEILQF